MRILERNKQDLWYANPTGNMTYRTDESGFKTGEKNVEYDTPVKVRMSMAISSGANNLGSQGIATIEPFGLVTGYTHRAVTEDINCPMGELSHIWYGILPSHIEQVTETVNGQTVTVDKEVANPHNFVVVRKAKSLNHLIYYLKEVDVQ